MSIQDAPNRAPGGLTLTAALWLALAPAGAWAQASPPRDAAPAAKPAPAEPEDDEDSVSEVVVKAKRPPQPGAVVGDIKPELQLSPSDIQSYGVSTVTELLDELAPETRSDRGRGGEAPVVLLNGRRISGFNEIRDIPVEAIQRVDILPEEVSLKYGYSADQRVVNIVLRRFFRALTGELRGGAPTEGGQASGQAEGDLFRVRGDNRMNLDLKYTGQTNLTEADRDIIEPATSFARGANVVSPTGGEIDPALSGLVGTPVTIAGVPAAVDPARLTLPDFAATANAPNVTALGPDRTLLPASQTVSANGVVSRALGNRTSLTVNGTLSASRSDALQGLSELGLQVPAGAPFSPFGEGVEVDRYAGDPLTQRTQGWTAHLGSTLNHDVAKWRTSLTGAYDHADSQTKTGEGVDPTNLQALLDSDTPSFNPFAPLPAALRVAYPSTEARSLSDSANVQALASGPLLKLPAGALYASLKAGDTESLFDSTALRAGLFQAVDLSRNDANLQVNLDLPLLGDSFNPLPWLGDLSVNVNAAVDELSDFGLLRTIGYGVNWTPVEGLNLIVSHTEDQAAPTTAQLGGPLITTPGARIFDYTTGQTVDVTQVSGGTRTLQADDRNVTKVGLTWKPIASQNLTFQANYIDSTITDPIATFPAATAQIEAAFPDRFTRDADGELVEVDDRPVNFDEEDRREIRWGFDYSRPLGPQPKPRSRRPGGYRRRDTGVAAGADGQAGGAAPDGAAASGGEGADRSGEPARTADADEDRGDRRGGGYGGGGGRGGGGRGGRGGFGGGRGPGGRLQFAVYHTVYFEDRILIRPGVPALDLLNGSAASSTGGQPRQEIEAQAGFTLAGIGARLSADWKSGTVVRAGAESETGDLTFSDIATVNFRLFDNLGQQPFVLRRWPWLRGSRVTLSVTNLFDQRIDVRDAAGQAPLSYQAAYLDPTGRAVRLAIRKLWF